MQARNVTCSARRALQQRLLRDDAARVGRRRGDAQRGAPAGVDAALRRREADHDRAGEGDRAADDERAREALVQQQPGEHREEHRADVDEHRRGAGVDALLGGVEQHVVGAEPQQPAEHEPRHVAARRERVAPRTATSAPSAAAPTSSRPSVSGAGRQVLARGADADERRRPQHDGDRAPRPCPRALLRIA